MKILIPILAVGAILFSIFFLTGFYPVALVNGQPISYRTWEKAQRGAINFANAEAQRAGRASIDFSAPGYGELLRAVRRDTLTFLIEDAILAQEGKKVVDEFNFLVEDRVRKAIAGSGSLEGGARLVYGLSLVEFRMLVLAPQARRDVAGEALAGGTKSFDEWFFEVKKRKMVQLFFVPFRWNGERVE